MSGYRTVQETGDEHPLQYYNTQYIIMDATAISDIEYFYESETIMTELQLTNGPEECSGRVNVCRTHS